MSENLQFTFVLFAQLYAVSGEVESMANNYSFKTNDLLCWAFQVTQGMQYMEKLNVLHGDLAARNILLCSDNVVKICDFGLARSMYTNGVYCKKGTVWNVFGFHLFRFFNFNFYRAQKRLYHSSGWHSSQLEIIHLALLPMFGHLVSFCGSYFLLESNHTPAWKQENHFIYNWKMVTECVNLTMPLYTCKSDNNVIFLIVIINFTFAVTIWCYRVGMNVLKRDLHSMI